MSRIDWLDVAAKSYTNAQFKEMHVNDIAEHALRCNLINGLSQEEAAVKLPYISSW